MKWRYKVSEEGFKGKLTWNDTDSSKAILWLIYILKLTIPSNYKINGELYWDNKETIKIQNNKLYYNFKCYELVVFLFKIKDVNKTIKKIELDNYFKHNELYFEEGLYYLYD